MNQQYGRSLIEVIGVMAIMGLMTVAALGMFQVMRANQKRTIANAELEQIAANTIRYKASSPKSRSILGKPQRPSS